MLNEEMLTPEQKLNASIQSFDVLKEIFDNYSIREQLEMTCAIRHDVSHDENIIAACSESPKLSEQRKKLLDDIHEFQSSLIKENTKKREDFSALNSQVKNFEMSKVAMSLMADKELSLDMFNDTETPPIFANIGECKKHISTLHHVSDNCRYGKYNILIMGDFQSGKSTTLDVFCDGRQICAIGNGTPTSAVLVSATYAEEESMVVSWRTKEQFGKIFGKIKQFLPEFLWNEFDLDDELSREKLKKAIQELRESKHCPNVGQGDAKFLMLSDFILTYYDTPALLNKKSLINTIADIPSMTRFPNNGESTWKESGVSKFKIDDVLFVFIESAACFIPSKTLKKLNCTIIDSPGLFNSSYDTMVTEGAMVKAHAIMYVLPYYKGIGKDICGSLYTIKDNYPDVHKKLFIVNNLRLAGGDAIYEANSKQIQSMFGQDKVVHRYDARLSYLAQLRKLYDAGSAKEADYSGLMSVTIKTFNGEPKKKYFKDFDEAWDFHFHEYKYMLDGEECEDILEECGFHPLTKALEQFIAKNESYAVLISNGLKPMWRELKSIQNNLYKSYIEVYNTSRDELENKWQERIANAKEFQTKVSDTAKALIYDGSNPLYERMANEEFGKFFGYDFFSNLSKEIAEVLYDNKGELVVTKTLLENKSLFEKRFASIAHPLIKKVVIEHINRKFQYWDSLLESEQDTTVINLFTPMTEILKMSLQKEWEAQFDEDFSMQDYLQIPNSLSSSKTDEANKYHYNTNALSGFGVDMTLIGGLITDITVLITGLVSMITGYITYALLDPFGGGLLLALLFGLGGAILAIFAPDAYREIFVNSLSKKILPKLHTEAVVSFKSMIDFKLKNVVESYIDKLKVDIPKMENERDLALIPTPHKEALCFRAVEAFSTIDKQIDIYEEYKRTYIEDKTI